MVYRTSLPLLLFLAAMTCPMESNANSPIIAFVSVSPQKTFLSAIGGDKVEVNVMVGQGQSPATFEPTPRQMARLTEARIYFRVGAPFESVWLGRIAKINPKLKIVDMRDGLAMLKLEEHAHDRGVEHTIDNEELDPHVWTNPVNVIKMCDTIENALSAMDSENAKFYSANLEIFATRLQALHSYLKRKLLKYTGSTFMVYHPSWGYFARAYGLRQIAIERAGKEPGAATLAKQIKIARKEGVGVIFTQKQFSDKAAKTLASAIGARVVQLDPLTEDYFANMKKVADEIAGAVK